MLSKSHSLNINSLAGFYMVKGGRLAHGVANQDIILRVTLFCHKATVEHWLYNCAGDLHFRGKLKAFSTLVLITGTVLLCQNPTFQLFDCSPGTSSVPWKTLVYSLLRICISCSPKALVRDTTQGKYTEGVCCENPSLEQQTLRKRVECNLSMTSH